MARFIDRQRDLHDLDKLLDTPRARFIAVYGRRRIGKTTLLLHWVQQTGQPYVYWVARRETADATRDSLARALLRWAHPEDTNLEPPLYRSWEPLMREMARMLGDTPTILIFDEFPYAVESDPSLPSYLQAAWDHLLKEKPITLILAGSHIGMMVDLFQYQAPLYGRFTGRLPLDPLPYAALADFFPTYSIAERIATYAVVGGVPAYLERFSPNHNLSTNIRNHLFERLGMFRDDPALLISDLVRETRMYETVLRAIATGAHTPAQIGKHTGTSSSNLSPYLKRLCELRLVERRIPATVPREKRRITTRSRYHLRDPFLRFHFRFIEPNLEMVEQDLRTVLWEQIRSQFRAFVGVTAFEELCREWTLVQARADRLPFSPEIVGSHWSKDAQVDVAVLNWQEKAILLGECKWGTQAVGRSVVRELVDKAPLVAPGKDWQTHYVLFSRAGFTEAAQAEAGAQLVDLNRLDDDLRLALEP